MKNIALFIFEGMPEVEKVLCHCLVSISTLRIIVKVLQATALLFINGFVRTSIPY